jgi:hypothetical protein
MVFIISCPFQGLQDILVLFLQKDIDFDFNRFAPTMDLPENIKCSL